jgi:hypothetical protein
MTPGKDGGSRHARAVAAGSQITWEPRSSTSTSGENSDVRSAVVRPGRGPPHNAPTSLDARQSLPP